MNEKHLSDKEIQQYTLEKKNNSAKIAEHIRSCKACQSKLEIYQWVFSEVKEAPPPAFDFDLSALVLAEIEPPKPKYSLTDFLIYATIFIAAIALLLLFWKYAAPIFSGLSTVGIWLIITSGLTILTILSFESLKKYQRLMNDLDTY